MTAGGLAIRAPRQALASTHCTSPTLQNVVPPPPASQPRSPSYTPTSSNSGQDQAKPSLLLLVPTVLISAPSSNPAPSKRPPSLLVRPVSGPRPTGKLQVGSRTEVLILQPWSGLEQLPEASGVGGGGHLLTHARASHKYCHCRWHHDPVLSPQHAPSHGQSNAYFSLYFLCLSLSSLARQGGGGVGAVAGEWGKVCSVPSQLSLSHPPRPSPCA